MSNSIKDFIIDMGFDGKKALAGLSAIDKKVAGLQKRLLLVQRRSKISISSAGPVRSLNAIDRHLNKVQKSLSSIKKGSNFRLPKVPMPGVLSPVPGIPGVPGDPTDNKRLKRVDRDSIRARMTRLEGTNAYKRAAINNAKEVHLIRKRLRRALIRGEKNVYQLQMNNMKKLAAAQAVQDRRASVRRSRAFGSKGFAGSLPSSIAGGALKGVATVGVGAAIGLQQTISAGRQIQSLKSSMLIASGSTKQAAKDFEFVKEQVIRLGASLPEAAKGYMQLSVATQGVIDPSDMKALYTSTLEMSTALGLSAADTEGSLRAFVQMASKGKVTAEELKSQLGERLPGALRIAADAMGLTTAELFNMMENGKLMSADFLPRMAEQMAIVARQGGALASAMSNIRVAENALTTRYTLFMNDIFEGEIADEYAEILKNITEFLDMDSGKSDQTRKMLKDIMRSLLKLGEWLSTDGLELIEAFADKFNKLSGWMKKNISQDWGGLLTVIGLVISSTTLMTLAFGVFKGLFTGGWLKSIFKKLLTVSGATAAIGTSVDLITAAMGRLWISMTPLLKFLGVAGAIVGVAYGIAEAVKAMNSSNAGTSARARLPWASDEVKAAGKAASSRILALDMQRDQDFKNIKWDSGTPSKVMEAQKPPTVVANVNIDRFDNVTTEFLWNDELMLQDGGVA